MIAVIYLFIIVSFLSFVPQVTFYYVVWRYTGVLRAHGSTVQAAPPIKLPIPNSNHNPNPKTHPNPNPIYNPNSNPKNKRK